jgi:ribonuclease I
METLKTAIAKHFANRNGKEAVYHRHMARAYIKEVRACYPKPAQARAQAIYLEACRKRALRVLGA